MTAKSWHARIFLHVANDPRPSNDEHNRGSYTTHPSPQKQSRNGHYTRRNGNARRADADTNTTQLDEESSRKARTRVARNTDTSKEAAEVCVYTLVQEENY